MVRAVRRIAFALLVLALAVATLCVPLAPRGLDSHPHPVTTYDQALQRIDALRAEDTRLVSPECGTILLTHGARTPRVVVLLHGLTNCPAQWDSVGRLVFARGENVLIPRLPHHGYADRMTEDLAKMDARELAAFTDRVVDAAAGLGERVTIAGLSTGGVMAAWAAQHRADVDRAVVVAPMIGWKAAPGPYATAALTRLGGTLPNAFAWWDEKKKQNLGGPKHVYPRFATRSITATMQLGGAVRAASERGAPAARSLAMVTVGGDNAVDNGACDALVRAWRMHGREVTSYRFPDSLHLSHDIVDPEQVHGDPSITYPVLVRLIAP